MQRIRDEAHRFAITHHRQMRGKRTIISQLDEVPGIGPRRRSALLKHFGSIDAIRAASVEELAAVPGMTRKAAEQVKENL
jgi:excinuclease ABC subunit C